MLYFCLVNGCSTAHWLVEGVFFHAFLLFFPCFASLRFILSKREKMLHLNAGSHPNPGLAPREILLKKHLFFIQKRVIVSGSLLIMVVEPLVKAIYCLDILIG